MNQLAYVAVLSVGWGHLLGAAWFARHRMRGHGDTTAALLSSAFLTVAAVALLWRDVTPYTAALFWGLYGVTLWHTIENSIALRRVGLPLPAKQDIRHTAPLVILAVAVSVWSEVPLPDLYLLATAWHLGEWLWVLARRHPDRRLEIALLHVPGFGLAAAWLSTGEDIRQAIELAFDPFVYGAASVAHVFQTAWTRRL